MLGDKFELGVQLRDRVTGFQGITTGKCIYLNGCVQHLISPVLDKDGKKQDSFWIDEGQLEKIGDGIVPKAKPLRAVGGPRPDAPSATSNQGPG